ncbi:hypothetical protein B0T14DRAFT_569598 [Immersiella caudata]|uniref:Uncharacterized protein n=1 Tax=Immersiella caudata TaxID=314043 RepID=A0AA40BTZ7_9PEZI|nr:hypothetical protein B0T14DRAFT_569598 [Immersiella caudata]
MESWQNYNYYTNDPSQWIRLMNLSTAEWTVGPFPPNVIAITGALSDIDPNSLPRGSLVILFIGLKANNRVGVEKLVFGVTSGLVILWTLFWLFWSWQRGLLLRPRPRWDHLSEDNSNHSASDEDSSQPAQGDNLIFGDTGNNLSRADFQRILSNFYFEPMATELEPCKRVSPTACKRLTGEDLKDATDLAWEAVGIEAELRNLGGDTARTSGAIAELRGKKKVVPERIRDIVQAWDLHEQPSWRKWWSKRNQVRTATDSERKGLNEIKALMHRLSPTPTE